MTDSAEYKSLYSSLTNYCLAWEVVSRSAEQITASALFQFDQGFTGFAGHFPNKPILPAIVQLGVVRRLAEWVCDQKLQAGAYRKVKFKAAVMPREKISVDLSLTLAPDLLQGRFTLYKPDSDGEIVAVGNCKLQPSNK